MIKRVLSSHSLIYGVILTSLISISGCIPRSQPKFVSSANVKPAPKLMTVNHLFTIKGHFSRPSGIAVDAEGTLYIADSGKSLVHIMNGDGRLVESIGRLGWRTGEFDSPSDVAVDSQLRLYIADSGNNRIQRFGLISRRFSVIAGEKHDNPVESAMSSPSLSLNEPQGVASDARGYIYIADTWNHRILKIDALGRIQMEIGGLGWAGQQFRNPRTVTISRGSDICFVATGEAVAPAYEASLLLKEKGIRAGVLSMHSIKPLDKEALLSRAKNCKAIITVEEHSVHGGLGEACSAVLLEAGLNPAFKIVGIPDEDTVTGSQVEIFNHYGISGQGLSETAKELLNNNC